MSWILASASPRRKELLQTLIHSFEIIPSHIEEVVQNHWPVNQVAQELAQLKALDISSKYPEASVIGSDTVVRLDSQIFGKPQDAQDASSMLNTLSGQVHTVETGVCVCQNGKTLHLFTESTNVSFHKISQTQIDNYILTQEPFGKAGAYAIQGQGSLFIEKINGCYNNVVGLPIFRLNQILELEDYERNRQSKAIG